VPGRTPSLLKSLGNPQRIGVLAELLTTPTATHAALLERLPGVSRATLSKTLGELEDLGLVMRPGSNRGVWRLRFPDESRELIVAAAALSEALGRAAADADRALSERLRSAPDT
jgi:hypothetical protein